MKFRVCKLTFSERVVIHRAGRLSREEYLRLGAKMAPAFQVHSGLYRIIYTHTGLYIPYIYPARSACAFQNAPGLSGSPPSLEHLTWL